MTQPAFHWRTGSRAGRRRSRSLLKQAKCPPKRSQAEWSVSARGGALAVADPGIVVAPQLGSARAGRQAAVGSGARRRRRWWRWRWRWWTWWTWRTRRTRRRLGWGRLGQRSWRWVWRRRELGFEDPPRLGLGLRRAHRARGDWPLASQRPAWRSSLVGPPAPPSRREQRRFVGIGITRPIADLASPIVAKHKPALDLLRRAERSSALGRC